MKILILTTRYLPHKGGVENVVENLARKFGENNEVSILTSKESKAAFDVDDPVEENGLFSVKRIWMAVPRSLKGLAVFPIRFVLSLYKLNSYINSLKPDVINIHFLDDISIYAALFLMNNKNKYKIITNIHGNDLHLFSKNLIYKYFINNVLSFSTKIVVNSSYMYGDLLAYSTKFAEKAVVITNGLDIKFIQSVTGKKFLKDDYIFYVGRIVHKKGVDVLIKAFAEANIPDLKLMIEGSGEKLSEIEKLTKDLRINEKVVFTRGTLSYAEMIASMKGSLFGIIPSRIEPFGIVALEFMAAGVPVIVSKTGGLIDLIEDRKTGVFFNNEDVNNLKILLKEMYTNKQLRSSISIAQLNSVKGFDWKEIAEKYISLFKSIK